MSTFRIKAWFVVLFCMMLSPATLHATHGTAEIEFVEVGGELVAGTPLLLDHGLFNTSILYNPTAPQPGPVTDGDDFVLWQRNSGGGIPDKLPPGSSIGPGPEYESPQLLVALDPANPSTVLPSPWFDPSGTPVNGFLGVRTTQTTAGDPHYGWIELTVEYDPVAEDFDVQVHGYAYRTTAGLRIVAGQIPEPSSLGLLFAATGIGLSWRRFA